MGTVELEGAAFSARLKPDVVYDALRSYRANQRLGTASTKTRSFVSGGGKKPWRQKGTGRARHGSNRSPIWVGGGTVFGPQPRDYSYQMPKKIRRLAIRSVLSDRARSGRVVVLDDPALGAPKTKAVVGLLKQMNLGAATVLIVGGEPDLNLHRSARNIPGVRTAAFREINVYDLLASEVVVLTQSALKGLKEAAAG
jgi:large subunit ribosomal protein L4